MIVDLYPDKSCLKPSMSSPMYLNLAQSRKLVRLPPDRAEHFVISCPNSLQALPHRRKGRSRAERSTSSGTNCLSERAQNPAQSLQLFVEAAYAFGVKLKTLDRLVKCDARLEGEGSQSQQPGSHAYGFCHHVNHFDTR
jgi:hypothetical protein